MSIISIAADDCSLENLSIVTEQTRGDVERVDARTIASNFQSILMNPIIATGCMATIFLHKGLMFKNEVDDEFEVPWLKKEGKKRGKEKSKKKRN